MTKDHVRLTFENKLETAATDLSLCLRLDWSASIVYLVILLHLYVAGTKTHSLAVLVLLFDLRVNFLDEFLKIEVIV